MCQRAEGSRAEDLPRTVVFSRVATKVREESTLAFSLPRRFQGCAKMRQNIQGATRIDVDGLNYSGTTPAHGI